MIYKKKPPEWGRIKTVLLDMDGTLLDKHFDDHFWGEFVPRRYSELKNIKIDKAREYLNKRYRDEEGTLNWYDVDFWSRELGIDIPSLKKQVDHLIKVHPNVLAFLDRLKEIGIRTYLVTDAHGKTLELKMEKTLLAGYFDDLIISHDVGEPKQSLSFWYKIDQKLRMDPKRTLLAEDTVSVLETAERYGIRYLVYIAKPSSSLPAKGSERFFSIETFREILP